MVRSVVRTSRSVPYWTLTTTLYLQISPRIFFNLEPHDCVNRIKRTPYRHRYPRAKSISLSSPGRLGVDSRGLRPVRARGTPSSLADDGSSVVLADPCPSLSRRFTTVREEPSFGSQAVLSDFPVSGLMKNLP